MNAKPGSSSDRSLRVYWYWPHPHRGASPLLLSAMRPGDEFVVQALPSLLGESFQAIDEYEVVRDLPDPTVQRSGVRLRLRPVEITYRRSLARRRLVRRGFDIGMIELLVYQTDWFDLRALRARIPLLSMVHDVRPHTRSLPARAETLLLRRLYRDDCTGDLIVFSPLLRDELVADYHVEAERVHVIPHPLDGSDQRRPEVSRPPRPMALFFGTLRPNKGLSVLLAALDQLPADPGFDVGIAGAGDAVMYELLTRASERRRFLSLELGFVDRARKAELHSQASVIVLPYTEFHSFSGVLADAYAYRVPVVASDVGPLGEVVRGDGTGWVVNKSDPAALADALTQAVAVLDDEAERSAIVTRIAEAAQRHDYTAVGPQYRDALTAAVERQRTSRAHAAKAAS